MGSHAEPTTNAAVKLSHYLANALKEGWTTEKLAKTAGVSYTTAQRFVVRHKDEIKRVAAESVTKVKSYLVREAQAAQEAALAHLEKLRELSKLALEHAMNAAPKDGTQGRPVKLDEFGQPVPFDPAEFATTVKTCVSATRDLKKFADEVTGVDVVKAITIKTQSDKDGKMVSWSGVDSLANAIEAEIIKDVEALPMLEAPPAETWEF